MAQVEMIDIIQTVEIDKDHTNFQVNVYVYKKQQ